MAESIRNLATLMERERAERKMTKVDFAGLCGMTPPAFLTILSGEANPTIDTISRISTALDLPASELLLNQ